MKQKGERLLEGYINLEPSGRWAVSPLNTLHCVGAKPVTRSGRLIIRDDTLRSGANTPGVVATVEKKLRIAGALESIGVQEVLAGYAGIDEHCRFVRALKKKGSELTLGMYSRIWVSGYREEIDRAVDSGADIIGFVGSASPLQARALHPEILGDKFLDQVRKAISYAKSRGVFVIFGSADPGNIECFHNWLLAAGDAGADRLCIYDGRGWLLPETVEFLTRYARDVVGADRQIGVHCHDDFGLATANTLAAVRAGADAVDVTVLSSGHRCGNAALEQVVPVLEALYGIHTGIDLKGLTSLCTLVKEVYDIQVPPNAPVIGENMFKYGGLHIRAFFEGQWYLWESLRAETVGQARSLFFGQTALQRGPNGPLALKTAEMGIVPEEELIDRVIGRLEAELNRTKTLSEVDVERIIMEEVAAEKTN